MFKTVKKNKTKYLLNLSYSILVFYHELFLLIYWFFLKMSIKTNLLEEYINFVDSKTKQNPYFRLIIFLLILNLCFYFISFLNT